MMITYCYWFSVVEEIISKNSRRIIIQYEHLIQFLTVLVVRYC